MFCYALVAVAACLLAQSALAEGQLLPIYTGDAKSGLYLEFPKAYNVTLPSGVCSLPINVTKIAGCNPKSLRVWTRDSVPNPTVELTEDLKGAIVKRVKPCQSNTTVEVSWKC